MAKFRPKKRKRKMMDDGWFEKPRGESAKMASDVASEYRCPSCGHHIQVKIAVVIKSNTTGNFTVEPKITCDNCKREFIEIG